MAQGHKNFVTECDNLYCKEQSLNLGWMLMVVKHP